MTAQSNEAVICPIDCSECDRLVAFRRANEEKYPTYFNGAVPAFGSIGAKLLIVGLAPGLKGANQTGRPFTGDYAGDTLYAALVEHGLAKGTYDKHADDGLELLETRITNAVRCVPPENKPEASEINQCNPYLLKEIEVMPNLKIMISLGGISHKAIIKALGLKQKDYAFGHANEHVLQLSTVREQDARVSHQPAKQSRIAEDSMSEAGAKQIILLDSYHCSRYNVNTRRLTEEMFDGIIARAAEVVYRG